MLVIRTSYITSQCNIIHSEGCGRDWFHIFIENVIFDPQIYRKILDLSQGILKIANSLEKRDLSRQSKLTHIPSTEYAYSLIVIGTHTQMLMGIITGLYYSRTS